MDIKGVCYDVGRQYNDWFLTRQVFDPAATRRELQIIRDDLHCNAVHFQGTDIGRLTTAAAGLLPTGTVAITALLAASSTETLLELKLATYT